MSDVMIEARDLTKRYGDFLALSRASFEVRKGEVVGFLGPNGAGKSTTMKILTCFIAPSSGTAKINGHDIWEEPLKVREAIGYLPESTPLYSEMNVLEYLQWAAQMRHLTGPQAAKRILKVVEETGLEKVIGKPIDALSKGYRQRVGLAQALVHEPPILILDEPLSGLDPNQAAEIRELILEIGRERTVIFSTHDLARVSQMCERVMIISEGKLVADDTPDALAERAGAVTYQVGVLAGSGEGATQKAPGELAELFGKISGASKARVLHGQGSAGEIVVEVTPSGDRDLRADLSRAAAEADLVVLRLTREAPSLEVVFRTLTTGEAPAVIKSPAPEGRSYGLDEDEDDDEDEALDDGAVGDDLADGHGGARDEEEE